MSMAEHAMFIAIHATPDTNRDTKYWADGLQAALLVVSYV